MTVKHAGQHNCLFAESLFVFKAITYNIHKVVWCCIVRWTGCSHSVSSSKEVTFINSGVII
jgi:hypothetical protein